MNKSQVLRIMQRDDLWGDYLAYDEEHRYGGNEDYRSFWDKYSNANVSGRCDTSTVDGEAFTFLTMFGCPVEFCTSPHPNTSGHAYMRHYDPQTKRTLIIDPTIRQFCPDYPGVFVGSIEELRDYILAPGTRLENTSSKDNPLEAFERIWGEKPLVKSTVEQARLLDIESRSWSL